MEIDWTGSDSAILTNPAYPPTQRALFEQILAATQGDYPGHLWLATSGSTVQKWVGLSKHATLSSAAAVNRHLESDSADRWVQTLPSFHVGGLGIWARAHLSGAAVYNFLEAHPQKWNADQFFSYLTLVKGTLTSLVPAQLHDLVLLQRRAPPSLRAVILGGGRLQEALYRQAAALGWPVLPSYGMTECASQIATAPLGWSGPSYPPLRLLSHLEAQVCDGLLLFRGSSLLSAYACMAGEKVIVSDPKEGGWLSTDDRGQFHDGIITMIGRANNAIKIGGESVDLDRLEESLQKLKEQRGIDIEMTLVPIPDPRLGHVIHLVVVGQSDLPHEGLMHSFNAQVLPFERIRHCHIVSHFPRSPLGKMMRNELLKMIGDHVNLGS